jgi:hypothetical protein
MGPKKWGQAPFYDVLPTSSQVENVLFLAKMGPGPIFYELFLRWVYTLL